VTDPDAPIDEASLEPAIGELVRRADAAGGAGGAADELFTLLYRELHRLAERHLRRGDSSLTLSTTTLLHEAYLRLSSRSSATFESRGHFLAYASRAMRRLVIDYSRRRRAGKRGGEFLLTAAHGDESAPAAPAGPENLDRISGALDVLARADPALAELVDLHFFAGFSLVEIARLRSVSERTVQRDWRKARLLLFRAAQETDGDSHPAEGPTHAA
jgi:RNA polymerase sigma factor (TIGR02999 family)